uniref:(northern house mosquito) hypothetical protein n=1 Tax=Culex pipiens TaxID=7175 RepID=A0A8D8HDC8_CULPI
MVAPPESPGQADDADQVLRKLVAMHLLHVQLHLRLHRDVGQTVAVGPQAVLVRLPASIRDERHLVVLHDLDGLLLVPDGVPVCRRQAEGLLADVHPPHDHDPADGAELGVQPAPGGIAGAARPRLRRHLPGGRQDHQVRPVSKGVRHHLRRVHGGVDRDAARPLPAHHLQHVGGSAEHTADVPRVLHLQHAADSAAGAAHRVDLPDHPDRDQGDQVGTDGGRRPVELERRTVGQLGERAPDRGLQRRNPKEAANGDAIPE